MNRCKGYLIQRGWIPNQDTNLWIEECGNGTVYTTAEAWKIQFVQRDNPDFPERCRREHEAMERAWEMRNCWRCEYDRALTQYGAAEVIDALARCERCGAKDSITYFHTCKGERLCEKCNSTARAATSA